MSAEGNPVKAFTVKFVLVGATAVEPLPQTTPPLSSPSAAVEFR
jgi:hypothetical protein